MFGFAAPKIIAMLCAVSFALIVSAYFKGRIDGKTIGAAQGVIATMDQLQARGQINEAVRNLDECDLIIELGGVCE
jgi:hypothetical protein